MRRLVVVGERYHLVAPLGQGGMGTVYDAVHAGTGRRVAVKLLRHDAAMSERARGRFVREARLAGGLDSPYVAEVLDAGTDEASGLPYIAMEFLEGEDLRCVIARRGKLPAGLVLVIAAHVAAGLAAAHDADVIHRDVKPANIVLCRDRDGMLVAKLVDFGVAKPPAEDDATVTETGALVGSLPYMSPEQLRGEAIDARTDLWSLGIVMYEALAGARPTGSSDAISDIVLRACVDGIPSLATVAPWVPRSVVAVVMRALSVKREERFGSAREMHAAIASLVVEGTKVPAGALETGENIVVDAELPGSKPAWTAGTSRAALAGAAGCVLTLVIAIVVWARAREDVPMRGPTGGAASVVAPETARAPAAVGEPPAPAAEPEPAAGADAAAPRERAAGSRPRGGGTSNRGGKPPAHAPGTSSPAAARSADPLGHM